MPGSHPLLHCLLVASTCAGLSAADWATDINLEVHGFASFGYLQTGENNWMAADTTDGTTEMVEAALTTIARPGEGWRLGAQLFLRDFGDYDNGKPQLDWAYIDRRFSDAFGLQAGRVKIPFGLYNEIWDVDAARTPVFLPRSIYDQRLRDLFLATDGGKAYGCSGDWEYAVYLGDKHIDEEAGFGRYFELGTHFAADRIEVDYTTGGMVTWHSPIGLDCSLSYFRIEGLDVHGIQPAMAIENRLKIDYRLLVASLQYDLGDWSLAAEGSSIRGRGSIAVPALAFHDDYEDDRLAAYLSATWHLRPDLDLYLAQEYARLDYNQLSRVYDEWSSVLAVAYRPHDQLTLKAELQYIDGEVTPLTQENPDGLRGHWWIFALKTTVDF
jgi:hypothetical protein